MDSLTINLKDQLAVQSSISLIMRASADTLGIVVSNYEDKLSEVSQLYLDELYKQGKPWYLTGKGLKGFFYGVFIGSVLILSVSLAD